MLDVKMRCEPSPVTPAMERSLLSGISLFHGVRPEKLHPIEHVCRYRRFSPQETIIDRDSPTRDVFFVVRGRVRVINYSVSGREIAFEDLNEGSYFGEVAAIDTLPRTASVITLTDSLIVALPAKAFLDVLCAEPEVALRVMRRMAGIIRVANERIMDLSTLAAYSRVQAEVLRQARHHRIDDNAALIHPIPLHSDIASRASTTRETVARVLNDLARKDIVRRTSGGLLIRNLDKLDEMVRDVRG